MPTIQGPSDRVFDNLPGYLFESLICKKSLSDRLEISQSFINKLMIKGLPHYKIGSAVRFRVSEVVDWLRTRRRP